MASAQEPKNSSELRQEIFFNQEKLEELGYSLARLNQYEQGSTRHIETINEYFHVKRELENLQDRLSKTSEEPEIWFPRKTWITLLIILLLIGLVKLSSLFFMICNWSGII